jgi:hypothetical protein
MRVLVNVRKGTTKFAHLQILSGKSFRSFKSSKGDRVVFV